MHYFSLIIQNIYVDPKIQLYIYQITEIFLIQIIL